MSIIDTKSDGLPEFANPFRPGAGHQPPYLAGRDDECNEFDGALNQTRILENLILTGLRGVGKTVLLETFKPLAAKKKWLWVGQDMSESATNSEINLAERLITDLSLLTSSFLVSNERQASFGFGREDIIAHRPIGYKELKRVYEETPGLTADKIKGVLFFVWRSIPQGMISGIVFAYDEAQNLVDHKHKDQFPLSVLLDVFQSIQRMGIPFLLVLTGLPTLFPKLVEARTYTERMFHIIFLSQLSAQASREAATRPVQKQECPITFSESTVDQIVKMSGGYPYFIQFICKEIFDVWIRQSRLGQEMTIPTLEIEKKLDNDFFIGRWANATDRQRQLMHVISMLENCDTEFSVQELVNLSKEMLSKPFSPSQTNQMLVALGDSGLIFKNRYGKYSFAVPLLSSFIKRQIFEACLSG
ncbi:ATP-binding protein [Acidiphilium sp.]|uniref:ATP-binding protein n=1 Tax=Acidiphilium sp. TaxID=527 RepID=UPI00258585D0|nr:ATP-binding protein [Acidiphilium sp.]